MRSNRGHRRIPRHATRATPQRSRILTTIVVTLALAGILTLSVEALRPAASAPATSSTAVLGAWVGGDSQAATEQLEASIGRKLDRPQLR